MTGDKTIRAATAAVVVAVAGFAAVQSYSHIYSLAAGHGQDRLDSALLPLSVDGLILAASLVLLHAARGARPAGRLAYFALWLGIGATIGANAAYGWPYGPLGIASSTWPALSFVLAVHVAMGAIKRARPGIRQPLADYQPEITPRGDSGGVPSDVVEAAKASMAATVAAGNPWSVNQLQQQFSLTRAQATKVRQAVLAGSNGHLTTLTPGTEQHITGSITASGARGAPQVTALNGGDG